jgi:hypothetical protein
VKEAIGQLAEAVNCGDEPRARKILFEFVNSTTS